MWATVCEVHGAVSVGRNISERETTAATVADAVSA